MLSSGALSLSVMVTVVATVAGEIPGDCPSGMISYWTFSEEILNEDFDDVIGIKEVLSGITLDDLRNALKKGFEEALNVKMISDNPTDLEIGLAKELESKRYSTDGWNLRR